MTTTTTITTIITSRSAELSNALAQQKDTLLRKINVANDSDGLQEVLDLLHLFTAVWRAADYGYKIKEIVAAIRERATAVVYEEKEFLAYQQRNGSEGRSSTEVHIAKLERICSWCS